MAAEASLMPDMSMGSAQSDLFKDDQFLQDLLNNQGMQGDVLTSLFEMPNDSLQGGDCLGAVGGTFNLDPLLNFPTSPVNSEGYSTESSSTGHLNGNRSPAASIPSVSGSVFDQQSTGDSPSNSPLMTSSMDNGGMLSDSSHWMMSNMHQTTSYQMNFDGVPSSSEVTIDVESLRASTSVVNAPSPDTTNSSSSLKAPTLVLSDEEKKLLTEEGITLPTDMPLTKAEQKHLKRIRRKIKNKISAQESRKKKKEYVEGLEDRVKLSTEKYQRLAKEADQLRTENRSLTRQLQELQDLVAKFLPSKAKAGTAGTILMVMVLSFSLFLVPLTPDHSGSQQALGRRGFSRNLLFAETDQFGNVIDPNTKTIITVAGGKSPYPLPPWLAQTPVVLKWMNITIQPAVEDPGPQPPDQPELRTDVTPPHRDDASL